MKKVRKSFKVSPIKFIVIFTWVGMTVTYGFQAFYSNHLYSKAEYLVSMQQQIKQLELENKLLENEIASRSALTNIDIIAKQMGFTPVKGVKYIK